MAETKMLHTKAEVISKGIKADEGVIDAIIGSSNVLDRIGDIIDQAGWKLQAYKKTNPVILWGHNAHIGESRPPIGKALRVWVQDRGKKDAKLMFKVKFDLQDNFAKEIFRKVKDGFINAVSVGFKPLEWELLDEDNPMGGRKYIKQELLELSFVPIPANPEALVALKNMKDKRFAPVKLEDIYPQKKGEPKDRSQSGDKVNKKLKKKLVKKKKTGTGTKKPKEPKKAPVKKLKKKLKIKPEKPKPLLETKGVIPFKDLGTVPESAPWDGSGEKAKAEVSDLKLMCTWYDSKKPDTKGSYKLPHHKAEGHKCVWRGVAAAMAALLGARSGVQIPTGDRKGVYNHLKKHYKQFDKEIPDFKAVEDQLLKGFDEEIHALILDREDRHAVRLIKKVLRRQVEVKKEVKISYTQEQIKSALKVLDSVLSQISDSSPKGGGKKG